MFYVKHKNKLVTKIYTQKLDRKVNTAFYFEVILNNKKSCKNSSKIYEMSKKRQIKGESKLVIP